MYIFIFYDTFSKPSLNMSKENISCTNTFITSGQSLLYGVNARMCPISLHFLTRWVSRLLELALALWAFAHVGVHRLPLLPSIFRCFLVHSSSPAIQFLSCFFFTTEVLAPVGRPFTYKLLRWVARLGTGSDSRCGPRGGEELRTKHKSRLKFLPWPGFEPRTLPFDGHERCH